MVPPTPAPTAFATAASLVARNAAALTTPYVFSPECTPQLLLSSGVQKGEGPLVVETFLYQNLTDHYTSCQPPGLTVPFHMFYHANVVYHGAVCPSGWHGFQLGERSTWSVSTGPSTWSTAKCCKSGDSLVQNLWELYRWPYADIVCASSSNERDDRTTKIFTEVGYITINPTQHVWTYTGTTTREGTIYTTMSTETFTEEDYDFVTTEVSFTTGRVFYPPMSMEWVEGDNSILSPAWPILKNDMLVPTWQSIDGTTLSSAYENRGRGHDYTPAPPPSIETRIAYPIIGVLAGITFIMAIIPLWRLWRRKRRAADEVKTRKWKDELNGRVPEVELEMADLGAESEVGRDGLGRSEVGSEVYLNGVPNTLPIEGDEEVGRGGGRW